MKILDSFDNSYYQMPEMYGKPYKEFQDFFRKFPKKGKLLDLGSGQGRDSIFLASLGFQVTAVDSSKVGINQIINKAQSKKLEIKGIVSDIQDFELEGEFDVVLFDMILHSFEQVQQFNLLRKYSRYLNNKGIFCIVFPDDFKTDHFLNVLGSLKGDWKLLNKIIIKDVPKIKGEKKDFSFIMLICQKNM